MIRQLQNNGRSQLQHILEILLREGLASAMSEGAEEGVQYLNSKEDFAKKYGWNAPSIGDIIANDFIQGSRVAKAYLSVLGLADSE